MPRRTLASTMKELLKAEQELTQEKKNRLDLLKEYSELQDRHKDALNEIIDIRKIQIEGFTP